MAESQDLQAKLRDASAGKRTAFEPQAVSSISETGLNEVWLQDLILKVMYYGGVMRGSQIAEAIH